MGKSYARYLHMQNKTFKKSGNLINGDQYKDGVIFRFKNGLLHGEDEPAIETEDGHMEFYRDGIIGREDCHSRASVITDGMDIREYWDNGNFIRIERD